MPNDNEEHSFLFYGGGHGTSSIRVLVEDEDTWLTQKSLSEVFDTTRNNISIHLKNIFESGELEESSVSKEILHTAADGKKYNTKFYSLDAILSVGYRVNSKKAILFRQWASKILKEFLIKGFAMDDERLKQGKTLFGQDYFDELLERIKDIRASERRFYQKVTDIYQKCSWDYNVNADITQKFFKTVQSKLEYAVTGMTPPEIITKRADHQLPHMGLTTWTTQKDGGKIRKRDTTVAKNYLTEDEINDLRDLVSMFLDFADRRAKKQIKMSMSDWVEKLDGFLKFNEYEILSDLGKFKRTTANKLAEREYEKFKPIQDAEYVSDFDKAVENIRRTGKLPDGEADKLRGSISNFDRKLKQALKFNPKDKKQ